jgi:hypothetical protein
MFRGIVKGTGYPLNLSVSHSLPIPCITVCHHVSSGFYNHVVKTDKALTNRPRLETRPPPHSYGNQRLQRQFEMAPDDGHKSARNM